MSLLCQRRDTVSFDMFAIHWIGKIIDPISDRRACLGNAEFGAPLGRRGRRRKRHAVGTRRRRRLGDDGILVDWARVMSEALKTSGG